MKSITVPILNNFMHEEVIGSLTIDEAFLPPTPNYAFALGYTLLNSDTQEYSLVCVSPIHDSLLKLHR